MRAPAHLSQRIVTWFRENQRDLPWRRTRDPYAIWISEVMLQQTQVKTVIPYWERWMRELPTIPALAEAPPDRVLKLWEGLGYYSRARNLQRAAQSIVADHAGSFPRDFDSILNLPGIGRYTAGAISSIAFGDPTPIVDGNVIRVLSRYFGIRGDPKDKKINALFWTEAENLVRSTDDSSSLNQGLMELGATVCLPASPRCEICPIADRCYARNNCCTSELPEIPARGAAEKRYFRAYIAQRNGSILLRQRPKNVVNSGFWELPNEEQKSEIKDQVLCVIKHSITRYRMTLEVIAGEPPASDGKWISLADLPALPLVNAHRKALQKLGLMATLKP